MEKITIQRPSLVVMMGIAGSGKSRFCKEHFSADEVVSSDECRRLVWGSERNQTVNQHAFELVHKLIDLRLDLGALTVADVTGLSHRQPYIDLARKYGVPVYLFVYSAPIEQIREQDAQRERTVGDAVISKQKVAFEEALRVVESEDWDDVIYLDRNREYKIEYCYANEVDFPGPYDIFTDIHGCYQDFIRLLERCGWELGASYSPYHPDGRRAIFLGDYVDRGPDSVSVLDLVRRITQSGNALAISGNHDNKLRRYLQGNKVKQTNGLMETIEQIERNRDGLWKQKIATWLNELPPYLILDHGNLVATHAGIEKHMIGTDNKRVRDFCLYGEMLGNNPETGLPIRRDWAADYNGPALIVYGHQPQIIETPVFRNNTVNLDLACVFGNKLAAMRYPEREFIVVDSTVDAPRPFEAGYVSVP